MAEQRASGDGARESVAVVVVTYNRADLLEGMLAGLRTQDRAPDGVIVVDNASRDGSADDLPALPRPLRLIRNAENLGFGRACDQGAAAGDAPAILFLNPDTQVAPDAPMREVMEALKHGPLAVRDDGPVLGHVTSEGVLARLLDPRS